MAHGPKPTHWGVYSGPLDDLKITNLKLKTIHFMLRIFFVKLYFVKYKRIIITNI